MSWTTFDDYKAVSASEKTGLCILEGAKRLVGWSVFSGSIYEIPFAESLIITSLEEDGVALTLAASAAACTAGKYYFDNVTNTLYCRLTGSGNPDNEFMVVVFKYFFSTNGVKAPHDLSTGHDVYWQPLLMSLSDFRLEVDNKDTQLGLAIEGSGVVKFVNDQSFWASRYDKIFFDNQRISVYAWERTLPITQAQILFRGRVQNKTYTTSTIQFQAKDVINDLRDVFELDSVSDVTYDHVYFGTTIAARVNDAQAESKQRLIYGKANGVVAMNIDQVLPDTPERRESFETGYQRHNDGTFDVTNGAKTVQANGTFRTSDIMPGDQLLFSNDLERLYTVEYYTSLVDFVLTENFAGTTSTTVTARIFPSRQRRLHNRQFLVAGHPLSEVATTIQTVTSGATFRVVDATGLLAGDNIIVTSAAVDYDRIIESITDTNLITTTVLISPIPIVGDAVIRPGIQKVYLNKQLLIQGQDYTVDSENALINLELSNPDSVTGIGSPEFNHTKVQTFSGRVHFTNGSFEVAIDGTAHSTGQTTSFTTEFRPGDYIQQPNGLWREIWYVLDDQHLVLSGLATEDADSENGLRKRVEYYQEGIDKIICDVRGRTDDNTANGVWLRTAPDIISSILSDAGITDIDTASFTTAAEEVPFDVSLVIPELVEDQRSIPIRDVISQLNRSVFGSLIQNSDLDLEYKIISADKVAMTSFDRADVVDFSILSDGSKLVKSVIIGYDKREMSSVTLTATNRQVTTTSDIGRYILKLNREFTVNTNLVEEDDATIISQRWAFLLELATSKLTAQIKVQAATLSVGDPIEVNHPKLYQRFGSGDIRRRLGVASMISRGITKGAFTIDDLANAFSRVCTIAAASASDYVDATDSERVTSGYITEANGLVNSDPDTLGLNIIW